MTDEIETYTRTVQVPVRTLTAKKAGLVNRAMKDYLRARKQAAAYLRENDPFDFGYTERETLRKEINAHSRVNLPARMIYPAITEVEQNYKEYEKAQDAAPPEPSKANILALEGQNTRIFYNEGYWLDISTGPETVQLPILTSSDEYHSDRLPVPESIPNEGRTRIGVKFSALNPENFPADTVKLSTSTLSKRGEREFVANLVFQIKKRIKRPTSDFEYLVGVDRGRNELAYACLYNIEEGHVEDWSNFSGDEVRHYMDEYADRIQSVQEQKALTEMDMLRTRRLRYKEQKDYEVANAIVDLARGRFNVAIVLEELSNMSRMGNYTTENRRFSEWSYYRLAECIKDKAEPYDIPVIEIDPAYTSQHCSRCGSDDTERGGVHFNCRSCGYDQHADANAAVNIAKEAVGNSS